MEALAGPGLQPFAIAALMLAGLVALEIVSTLVGLSFTEVLGKDFGEAGLLGGLLGWINPGGVPILVLILVLLAGFSAAGYALQALAAALWQPLPLAAAVPLAGLVSLRLSRSATRLVARVIPSDETYAVGDADLIGRVAEVTVGPLDAGPAGRVKLQDQHGNWHFPLARAAQGSPIAVGTPVLLVDRDGPAFLVIPATGHLRAPAA
jgi:membrane protein implicated in regulation of membrane protease activity